MVSDAGWAHAALLSLALGCAGSAQGDTDGGDDEPPDDPTGATAASGAEAASSAGQTEGSNDTDGRADAGDSGSAGDDSSGSATSGPAFDVDCDDFAASLDSVALMDHLAELQAIGDAHGNRSVGTEGFDASSDYVRARLAAAGYDAIDQDFEAPVFEELEPPRFSAGGVTYAIEEDFFSARYSGSGTVSAPLVPIDVDFTGNNQNNSACQPDDFDGFTPGSIALIQRGGCTFANKVGRAAAAGAAGVVIFNQGGSDDRQDAFLAGIDPEADNPPVVITSFSVGEALALSGVATATLEVDALTEFRPTRNVIVERSGTDTDQVVMFGAHLDSVEAGPGINDNGTGSMALLAIAERLSQCNPARTVRFAWWGAEEIGLVGSQRYVDALSASERDALMFYLNFDMIGSPNFVRFVHDGDGSRFGTEGPVGSDALEQFFHDHFAALELPTTEARFDGRSDYGPFLDAQIPTGGLLTGAEGSKSGQEVELYGGQQGEWYDPCYHQSCDVQDDVPVEEYTRISQAIATAVARFGIEGEGLFSKAAPQGPQGLATSSASALGCGHALARE